MGSISKGLSNPFFHFRSSDAKWSVSPTQLTMLARTKLGLKGQEGRKNAPARQRWTRALVRWLSGWGYDRETRPVCWGEKQVGLSTNFVMVGGIGKVGTLTNTGIPPPPPPSEKGGGSLRPGDYRRHYWGFTASSCDSFSSPSLNPYLKGSETTKQKGGR